MLVFGGMMELRIYLRIFCFTIFISSICFVQITYCQHGYSAFQKKYQKIFINYPETLEDNDGDGLDNKKELQLGTNPYSADSDGDGLDDYLEVCKYHTDPLMADSDGDDIPDSVWSERYEHAYTIKVIAEIGQPYDIKSFESFFFDAKVISADNEKVFVEYIVYPLAEAYIVPLKPQEYPPSVKRYLETDIVTKIEGESLKEVLKLIEGSKSDLEKLIRIIDYVAKNFKLKDKLFAQSEPFMEFYFEKDKISHIHQNWSPEEFYRRYSIDSILELNCLVQGMIKNKSKGACGSTAALMAGLCKSVGIPCRIKQSFPIATNKDINQVKLLENIKNIKVKEKLKDGVPGDNHFFNEVYLNGHWIDLDHYRISNNWLNRPFLKSIHFNNWHDVNFAHQWESWCKISPKKGDQSLKIRYKAYRVISIIEQKPKEFPLQIRKKGTVLFFFFTIGIKS